MSDYVKTTNFTAKDTLPSGDANKLIKGSEFDVEYDAIATAVATKYDSTDLASQAEAEAETASNKLVTPERLAQWSDDNAGIVGDLRDLTDPGADRLMFWDDSASAAAFLTPSTGLAISGTNISLSHLGIQSLTDPNDDRIFFWDDSAGASAWLDIGSGLSITGTTLAADEANIAHDSLSGFVANEHIDHSSVSITAGTGLSGGGTIAATRTLNVDINGETAMPDTIVPASDLLLMYDASTGNHYKVTIDEIANAGSGFVADTREIASGNGLTGGGDLSLDRTLAVGAGTGITVNADDVALDTSNARNADHSAISITAGAGLSGGGTIESTRSIALDLAELGTETSIADDDFIAMVDNTDSGSQKITFGNIKAAINHDNLTGFVANEHIDHSAVTLTAGAGLTGGGTIAASRSFAIGEGTGITVSADAISTNDSEIVHDSLSGFVAAEHVNHASVSITAGSGLTGGGTIEATRTINVGAGTGISVAADSVSLSHLGIESLADPNDDRILFWDDSAGATAWLDLSSNLSISGTTLDLASSPTVTSLSIGNADTTLSRDAAGQLAVEGSAVFTHDDASLTSAKVFISDTSPTGGSNGDVWYEY